MAVKSVGFKSSKNFIFIKRPNKAIIALMSNFQYEKLCFYISTILHDFIIEHENRASTIRARSCTIDKLDMHENRARNTIGFLARFLTLVCSTDSAPTWYYQGKIFNIFFLCSLLTLKNQWRQWTKPSKLGYSWIWVWKKL